MGPIRRSETRKHVHYDPEMPENWTLIRLRQELNARGIRIPQNSRRMALVRLLRESGENVISDVGRNAEGHADTILGSVRSQNSTATDTTINDHLHDALLGSAASQDASVETNNRTLINIVSRLSTTVQSLQQNVTTLTGQVNTLITQRTIEARDETTTTTRTGNTWIPTFASTGSQRSEEVNNANGLNFNLETAYSALRTNALPTAAAGSEEQALRKSLCSNTKRLFSRVFAVCRNSDTTSKEKHYNRTDLGAKPQSPLFVNDDYDHTPLSRDRFISLLRDLLFRLWYKDDKFCGHSFRIGAATSAAAAGIEDHIIQTLGRWSSDCYMRYIRTNPKTIHAAQDKMCF
ncbi:unnamed protein product [Mytilus coruscus]|uniref:Tyr recombinase domain-containing protein n=1 Tax=Mytilus coruscus TaxID=42192 RepID=A0A6J8AJ69_MYTCO|nr:unnamed protein product [Mytilus coruscus]